MLIPDVNVLVYAHRPDLDPGSFYREWLASAFASGEHIGFTALTIGGFLRVATAVKPPEPRTPPEVALATIRSALRQPNARLLELGHRHNELIFDLVERSGIRGSSLSDVAHAAVAIEHGCTLVSRDRDLARLVPFGLKFQHLEPPTRA